MPDITKGKTFTSGETVTATELNSLVDDAVINNLAIDSNKLAADAVTNVKVAASAAIDWDKMAALSSGQILVGNSDNQAAGVAMSGDATISNTGVVTLDPNAIMPSGSITQYAGSTAPTGWLICDGTAVSRTTYASLFAIVSTTYGTGDGSTTFNLPDLRGRVAVGVGQQSSGKWNSGASDYSSAGTNFSLGGSGGTEDHKLVTSEMPSHNHANSPHDQLIRNNGQGTTDTTDNSSGEPNLLTSGTIQSAGGDSAHNNLQPWLAVNYIIKT